MDFYMNHNLLAKLKRFNMLDFVHYKKKIFKIKLNIWVYYL